MKIINTKAAPQPIGPYSQGTEADGLIFLSGQIGLKPDTGELAEGLVNQTHQVMRNIGALLESAGSSFAKVMKTTVYITDMGEFGEFNKVYSEYFKESPPARTTVEVSALPKNAVIEIEIIAHK